MNNNNDHNDHNYDVDPKINRGCTARYTSWTFAYFNHVIRARTENSSI